MPQKLSALPVGTLIKDTGTTYYGQPIIWKIADQNHGGYPANSTTLITEKIIRRIGFDGKEAENANSSRAISGSNRYRTSNIRQWLNSEGAAGSWWTAQNLTDGETNTNNHDAPPTSDTIWNSGSAYDTEAGFLTNFSAEFKSALLPTELMVAKNTVTDGGGSETVIDKIFLASLAEVGFEHQTEIIEGSKLSVFVDDESRKAMIIAEANDGVSENLIWTLRSPTRSTSQVVFCVPSDGAISTVTSVKRTAMGNHTLRPLCNLSSEVLISDSADTDGVYTIIWSDSKLVNLGGLKKFYQNHNSDAAAHPAILAEIDSLKTIVENNGGGGGGATKVKLLGDCAIGDIVYINENNAGREYIVIQKGNPDPSIYDASCDGVWLMREMTYNEYCLRWNKRYGSYDLSAIHEFLHVEFLGSLDINIRRSMKLVKIPFVDFHTDTRVFRTGDEGLPCKAFVLSSIEVGFENASNDVGSKLSYFLYGEDVSATTIRKYKRGETYSYPSSEPLAINWWLRTGTSRDSASAYYVTYGGKMLTEGVLTTINGGYQYHVRPVFILPSTLYVDSDGYVTP